MRVQRTLALLVGIETYPELGESSRLHGALADVDAMVELLSTRAIQPGFQVLRDQQATRQGIRSALEDLLREAGNQDEVLFFWAGHGSQVRDASEDEEDGWDETLVPYDSGRIQKPNRDLLDDEINQWLHRLRAKTRHITLIVDACHSGTVARTGVRTVPKDPRPQRAELEVDAFDASSSFELGIPEGCVVLSACRDDQEAIEVDLRGQVRGAFTWALEEEIRAAEAGVTWREIFSAVEARVAVATFGAQIPQIEGAGRRQVPLTR